MPIFMWYRLVLAHWLDFGFFFFIVSVRVYRKAIHIAL